MDVTFSETEMFFISDQTHGSLQGELNSKDEDYSWFDVPHERDSGHGPSGTGETETEDLGVISNPLDRALPNSHDTTSQSPVDLDRETPDREITHAVSNSRPTPFMDSVEGNGSVSDIETVQTENNPHSLPLVHAHVPVDIQEVHSHTPYIVENSYILPPRQNRGKPPDKFSPEGKVRYAIAHYVSTHRLSPKYQAMVNQMAGIKIPTKVEEALRDPRWVEAMGAEMENLQRNGTWNVVSLPQGKRPVGCKWVFTINHKADGSIDRYKAILVAKGYIQTFGVDYQETFAPVAKMNTIRVLLSLAANLD
ncbi:hypothetical protein COP1_003512 [Malus domestica]